jgi:C4-dicarboxylate transporter DctQ subunit
VHIELVTRSCPESGKFVSRLVALPVFWSAWCWPGRAFDLFQTNIERNDYDVRAYFYPRWLLTISFPVSFGLMAIEFSRFVFGKDLTLHTGEAGIHE